MASEKTIAKNTVFLYFRMLLTMLVSLYSSRIVLEALGAEDFGIYQTVGGIVVMLSFLSGALATGSARFLTFELGRGVTEKLRQTFCTLLLAHIILAFFMLVLGGPVGLHFLKRHVVIPEGRRPAAYAVFHLSILTSLLNITQAPYTSVIIAHERLSVYAYASIAEAALKLAVSLAVRSASWHRLELYALLLAAVQTLTVLFYRVFCVLHYEESRFSRKFIELPILKEVGAFSGWSLFAAVSIPLTNQGTLVLLNNYFSPAVVSARSVALQVSNAATQFVSNFRTASNPQIVKRYSAGDTEGSGRLLLRSTLLSFYLMLFLALPVYLLADPLLEAWLGNVPEHSAFFLKWAMIASLFSVFDVSFYAALYAKGRLKENALLSPVVGAMQFPFLYIAFKCGLSLRLPAYTGAIVTFVIGCAIKPVLLCKICGYRAREVLFVLLRCFLVTLCALPLPFAAAHIVDCFSACGFIEICLLSIVSVLLSVCFLGLDGQMRRMCFHFLRGRFTGRGVAGWIRPKF